MKLPCTKIVSTILLYVPILGSLANTNVSLKGDQPRLSFQTPDRWEYSAPLIAPEDREVEPSYAQKDPTVVYHDGMWHVFMTVKLPGRSAIEYCSFKDWETANSSERTLLQVSESEYYCAPQVFYFTPHRKWYLVYQVGGMPGANKMWVAYSTTENIADPGSWTPAKPMLDGGPDDPRQVGGLDYWIICDDHCAYLFITDLKKHMWRLWTDINNFPQGFDHFELVLAGDFLEASHTYRLKGTNQYLTFIEQSGQRYFKAYLADSLDGPWRPIADTKENPFAGAANIQPRQGVEPWTDNVSHGELVRSGIDQLLEIDPDNLQLVFQGMREADKEGKGYGKYPWRIGIMTPVNELVGQ